MQSESIGALVSAIGAVMAEVGYVRGTGKNSHHKYNYTSDEDLAAAVQPALVKHGVAILPVRVNSIGAVIAASSFRRGELLIRPASGCKSRSRARA